MIYYFAREKTHDVTVCIRKDLKCRRERIFLYYFVI